jgi:segregation and condensation protein A
MVERAIPWWRKALQIALGGLRSRFGFFPRLAKPEPVSAPIISGSFRDYPVEERALTEPSRKVKTAVAAAAIPAVPASAPEPAKIAGKGWNAGKRAEKQAIKATNAAVAEAAHETVLEKVEAAKSEPEAKPVVEPEIATSPEALIEAPPEAIKEPEAVMETSPETDAERAPAPAVEQAAQAHTSQKAEPKATPESIASQVPAVPVGPKRTLKPQRSEEEKAAARLAARQKKLDEGSEESPFSVIVGQVYDGPLDLLLDLIRKQDIDIYDIPIAIITAQFLAYVDQLRASDVDVAGDFIYTASLLIHIKSKMLLPHTETGLEQAAEDPRRELVERLLEHERFRNAAQMLLEKQMLEAATWTNPGAREFKDDVSAEPEIAADTVDLVRIFRVILERARNRPVIDVEEDSVTVSQMIQFLARRLTLEDKPVALRRLLSHSQSEQALITMFLALLEMVRLQAILLRQDRQFSEIFIKKHSNFETVMNEGLGNARDDWR